MRGSSWSRWQWKKRATRERQNDWSWPRVTLWVPVRGDNTFRKAKTKTHSQHLIAPYAWTIVSCCKHTFILTSITATIAIYHPPYTTIIIVSWPKDVEDSSWKLGSLACTLPFPSWRRGGLVIHCDRNKRPTTTSMFSIQPIPIPIWRSKLSSYKNSKSSIKYIENNWRNWIDKRNDRMKVYQRIHRKQEDGYGGLDWVEVERKHEYRVKVSYDWLVVNQTMSPFAVFSTVLWCNITRL